MSSGTTSTPFEGTSEHDDDWLAPTMLSDRPLWPALSPAPAFACACITISTTAPTSINAISVTSFLVLAALQVTPQILSWNLLCTHAEASTSIGTAGGGAVPGSMLLKGPSRDGLNKARPLPRYRAVQRCSKLDARKFRMPSRMYCTLVVMYEVTH